MSRIAEVFGAADSRRAFIPYLTTGFPTPEATPRLLDTLARTGADIIELGVPFSDPLADGPTVQRACWRALEQGAGLQTALDLVARYGRDLPPVVLFTYLNPILRMGFDEFADAAGAAGVAGLLVTDLPVGADPPLEARFSSLGLDLIRLVAPTTRAHRLRRVVEAAAGFVYYISRTGVTGAQEELDPGLADGVRRVRANTRLPVAVGFGVSTTAQARAVASVADGVVVGSALISALEKGEAAFEELAESLAESVHEVS